MFYFRLAKELHMTVGAMLAQMSSEEISEWMAFFSLEEEARKQRELERQVEAGLDRARRRVR